MKIWNKLKEVPKEYQSKITGGRLKGMSDIKPQWRILVMTETFGVCGIGWKYTIDKMWTEDASENQIMCFVNISLFINQDDKWSDAIPGTGGNFLVAKEKAGPHSSDEGYKMALTDALGVAMKAIGVGADIYLGKKAPDESKYQGKKNNNEDGKKPTKSQMEYVTSLMAQKQLSEDIICKEFGIKCLDDLTMDLAGNVIKYLSTFRVPKGPERFMCPNVNKYVPLTDCDTCESKKGCPMHAEDIG